MNRRASHVSIDAHADHKKRVLRDSRQIIGSGEVKGIGKISRPVGMRAFMKSIHNAERDTYDVVSKNLARESQKSMERLKALLEGAE